MQDEKTLQQMTREYETEMPQEIMAVITAFDWKKELREIVRENNLMLDVGSDLEQSVYLMILGAVKVDAVYERLVETHEMPVEKAQKVLYEIESRIFNQLSERLAKIDDEENVEAPAESVTTGSAKVSRDSILAEIENDVEIERPANNIVMPGGRTLPPASMEKASVMPGMPGVAGNPPMTEKTPQADARTTVNMAAAAAGTDDAGAVKPLVPASPAGPMSDRLGLRDIPVVAPMSAPKLFSMSDASAVEVRKTSLSEEISTIPTPVQEIKSDPVVSGLTAPTAMAAPQAQQTPRPITRATDPYREPIE